MLNKSQSGLWRGVNNGKTGWFKFSYVEPLKHVPETSGGQRKDVPQWQKRSKPTTVKEFLQQVGLEVRYLLYAVILKLKFVPVIYAQPYAVANTHIL